MKYIFDKGKKEKEKKKHALLKKKKKKKRYGCGELSKLPCIYYKNSTPLSAKGPHVQVFLDYFTEFYIFRSGLICTFIFQCYVGGKANNMSHFNLFIVGYL